MTYSAPTTTTNARDRLYRKLGFRLLPLLFVGYVVANLDRNNVAFAKLAFLPSLAFDESIFGIGAGLFYVGYVLCEIPSNLVLARIGVRATFSRIMALWFVFSFALAFMTQPWHYYVLRALLGGAEAGYLPGVLLYLGRWVPRARRGRFTALFMSAIPISGMIGAPIAGRLMHDLDGALGIAGWRWLFMIEAVPALVLAVVFYRLLLDKPADARWLSPAEQDVITADLAEDETGSQASGDPAPNGAGTALMHLKNPLVYMVGLQAFAMLSILNGLNLWGPTILKEAGVGSILQISYLARLPQIAGLVALLVAAELSDRNAERRFHTAIPSLAAVAGWALLPHFPHQPLAAVGLLTLIAIGVFGATGPFWAIPSQYIRGPGAAAGIALVTTMGGLGAMVSPYMVGHLKDATGSFAAGAYFYAAVGVIGLVTLLFGTRQFAGRSSRRR